MWEDNNRQLRRAAEWGRFADRLRITPDDIGDGQIDDVLIAIAERLLARIEALEEKVNAIKVGPGGALYGS